MPEWYSADNCCCQGSISLPCCSPEDPATPITLYGDITTTSDDWSGCEEYNESGTITLTHAGTGDPDECPSITENSSGPRWTGEITLGVYGTFQLTLYLCDQCCGGGNSASLHVSGSDCLETTNRATRFGISVCDTTQDFCNSPFFIQFAIEVTCQECSGGTVEMSIDITE